MELYCRLDVLLLAECFLAFRKEVREQWDLEAALYISLPQLSFDCMLKQTGAVIELMSDVNMVLQFEEQIRGGTSFIAERYVEATADELAALDAKEDITKLIYLDLNNLYGMFFISITKPVSK